MSACLITGGAGFIGSHLAETLLKKVKKVKILDNFSTGKMENLKKVFKSVEIIRGDIRNARDCRKAVKGVESVFHEAALTSVAKSIGDPLATHEINTNGTLNMLNESRLAGVRRFVYASSCAVYGPTDRFPIYETSPKSPQSPYAISKLISEHYADIYFRNYGLETVVLRYFNVYGPRQGLESGYSAVVPAFMDCFIRNKNPIIYGSGRQSRDFVYVEDIVSANLLAASSARAMGHVFNIASGEDHSILDIFNKLSEISGRTYLKPLFQKQRAADPARTSSNISQAKHFLNWSPRHSLDDGLKKTMESVIQKDRNLSY